MAAAFIRSFRPNGSKLWRMKYRFAGKEKLLSFGAYPTVGLGDARLKRAKAKIALADGLDSGSGNENCKGKTFEQAARAWHANRFSGLDVEADHRDSAASPRGTSNPGR